MHCSLVLLGALTVPQDLTLHGLARYPEAAGGQQAGKDSPVPFSCPCTPAWPWQTWHFARLVFHRFNELDKVTGASAGEQGRERARRSCSDPAS